jgi:hypothetical protein
MAVAGCLVRTPPFLPPDNVTFFQRNFDEWAGMANVKHKPTGLFAFTAFSFSDSRTPTPRHLHQKVRST